MCRHNSSTLRWQTTPVLEETSCFSFTLSVVRKSPEVLPPAFPLWLLKNANSPKNWNQTEAKHTSHPIRPAHTHTTNRLGFFTQFSLFRARHDWFSFTPNPWADLNGISKKWNSYYTMSSLKMTCRPHLDCCRPAPVAKLASAKSWSGRILVMWKSH